MIARRRVPLVHLLWLTALVGCTRCGAKPDPPDRYAIERLPEVYDQVPAQGQVSNAARVDAALDLVSKDLGYGTVPVDVLRRHESDGWQATFIRLLADGRVKQVQAAWEILSETIIAAENMPMDVKLAVREGQARMYDYINAKQNEEFLRRASLAEIAWALYMMKDQPTRSAAKAP